MKMILVLNFRGCVCFGLVLAVFILTGCTGVGERVSGADTVPLAAHPVTATFPQTTETAEFIYILDLGGRSGALFSHLTAYNLLTNQIVFSLQTRGAPVPVLSPDGSRLYVADSYYTHAVRGEWRDVLSVYDARSGELLEDDHPIPERVLPKGAPLEDMFLFFSEEGGKLYLVKYGDPPDYADLTVSELDPLSLEVRREFTWPHLCKHLIQAPEDGWLCIFGGKVVRLDPVRGEMLEEIAQIEAPGEVASSMLSPDGEKIHLTIQSGASVSLVEVGLSSRDANMLIELKPPDGWIYSGREFVLAEEGALFFIGAEHEKGYNGYPDQIWGVCISDGEVFAGLDIGGEIDVLRLDPSGRFILLSGELGTMVLFDAPTQDKLTAVDYAGDYPAYLLIPNP